VAQLGLRELALGNLAKGELHGCVTVALSIAHGGDLAGAGLDHRYRDNRAVLAEDLGHAELLAEDRRHED
jgi:hypothetical protein